MLWHVRGLFAVAATALFLVGGAASSADAQLTARDLLGRTNDIGASHADVDAAIQEFARGETAKARESLKAAVANHPELPPSEVILALLYFRTNRQNLVDDGLLALERATVEAPDDPEPYILIAEVGLPSRRYAAADALLEKAVRLTAAYSANAKRQHDFKLRIYAGLAAVAKGREQFNKQAGYLKSWISEATKSGAPIKSEDSQVARVVYELAQAYFKDGKYAEAENTFKQANSLSDEYPKAAIAMGRMYNDAGDILAAQRYFDQAAQSPGDDFQTLMILGQWQLEQDNPQEAKKFVTAAQSAKPDSVEAMLLRGVVEQTLGDNAAAVEWFEKVHLAAPTDFTGRNQLALALAAQADEEAKRRAVQFAEVNFKLYPENSSSASTLGWIYYLNGQTAAALKVLNDAQRTTGLSSDGYYYVAKMYDNDRKYEEAKQYLQNALKGKVSFALRKDARELATRLGVSQ